MWESRNLSARLVRLVLAPASLLYAAGWTAYEAVYRLGFKQPQEPHRPVVCIGSLRAGGSGKTPFALYVCRLLAEAGRQVVLSASGYRSPRSNGAAWAPDGPLVASEWGDEAAMARWLYPNLPLIVGRDRVEAAWVCHAHSPDAVLVLDDGYQHLPLKKHLSIVLDPRTSNGLCLPAGPFRQPRTRLSTSDLLPDKYEVRKGQPSLIGPDGNDVVPPPAQVDVLCALGEPERFVGGLREAGFEVLGQRFLPDHDPLAAGNLFEGQVADRPLVVTCKDWVKLRERTDLAGRLILIAKQDVRVEQEDAFREWLLTRLNDLTS